jgi:hypothetical protein
MLINRVELRPADREEIEQYPEHQANIVGNCSTRDPLAVAI